MARRSDHTRDELIQLAIQSGIQVIETNGFQRFSARAVAANMGYTVGTLYHLFGSLDEFILHVNAQILDEWYPVLLTGLKRHKGDAVLYLGKAYLKFSRQNTQRFESLFHYRPATEEAYPEWYQKKMARFFHLIEDSLKGRFKSSCDINHLAKTIWAGVHGICVLSLSQKLHAVGADKAESMIETLLNATLHAPDITTT